MTASARTRRYHSRILDQLDSLLELARDLPGLELRRQEVSSWNVGEQLEHLVLVDGSLLKVLEKAEPDAGSAGRGPTAIGRLFLSLGAIPRGRGKAPSFASPSDVELDQVEPRLSAVRERFAALAPDLGRLETRGALARHPVFGHLDGRRWLRFAGIHHHHHWKIIRDIRRSD